MPKIRIRASQADKVFRRTLKARKVAETNAQTSFESAHAVSDLITGAPVFVIARADISFRWMLVRPIQKIEMARAIDQYVKAAAKEIGINNPPRITDKEIHVHDIINNFGDSSSIAVQLHRDVHTFVNVYAGNSQERIEVISDRTAGTRNQIELGLRAALDLR